MKPPEMPTIYEFFRRPASVSPGFQELVVFIRIYKN